MIKIYEPTQELNNKLAQSKIVVVPSRNEGFGMIILEAMVQDNIVISFEGNVGPDSIINNGDNGYLVNYENVSELAKRIDLTTQHYNELDHNYIIFKRLPKISTSKSKILKARNE